MSVAGAAPAGVFHFLPVDRIVFGPGTVETLPDQVEQLGGRRAFIITGRTLATKTNLVRRLEQLLGPRHAGTFAETQQHVPSRGVLEAANRARAAGADLLIAFGGGSPVDCTKLVALALAEGWTDPEQLNARADRSAGFVLSRDPVPQIAITTTLSAGEYGPFAGVTNETTGYKGSCGHPQLTPRVVILDPDLTLATPRQLWASTGIKALDHAVERLSAPNRQPITDSVCRATIRLLLAHLPPSIAESGDLVAHRGHCQVAAWLSNFGQNNVRSGLSHAIGHQLGARCGVPHGITSCLTIPHVVTFLGRRDPTLLAEHAAVLGLDPAASGVVDQVAARLGGFIASLGLPARLRDAGVGQAEIGPLAAAIAHEVRGRDLATEAELIDLLQAAW